MAFSQLMKKVTPNFLNSHNMSNESVNHPAHYGGADNPYEAIKVIEAWDLNFNLGNTVKYISRCGKKLNNSEIQELKKAAWYLNREIKNIEKNIAENPQEKEFTYTFGDKLVTHHVDILSVDISKFTISRVGTPLEMMPDDINFTVCQGDDIMEDMTIIKYSNGRVFLRYDIKAYGILRADAVDDLVVKLSAHMSDSVLDLNRYYTFSL